MNATNLSEHDIMLGFISGIGATELVLILLLVLILFGARKIPELAKGLGSGLREFKKAAKAVESVEEDIKTAASEPMSAAPKDDTNSSASK